MLRCKWVIAGSIVAISSIAFQGALKPALAERVASTSPSSAIVQRNPISLAQQIMDKKNPDRDAAFQALFALSDSEKVRGLREMLKIGGNEDYAVSAATELVRMAQPNIANVIGNRFLSWAVGNRAAVLGYISQYPQSLKSDPLLLDLPRSLIKDSLNKNTRAIGDDVEFAAGILLATGDAKDEKMVNHLLEMHPDDSAIWTAYAHFTKSAPEGVRSEAAKVFANPLTPVKTRCAVAAVLGRSGDVSAQKFLRSQELSFCQANANTSLLKIIQAQYAAKDGNKPLLDFMNGLELIDLADSISTPQAREDTLNLLQSDNDSIRSTAGMALARHDPIDLLKKGRGKFNQDEYGYLGAIIVFLHSDMRKEVEKLLPRPKLDTYLAYLKKVGGIGYVALVLGPPPGIANGTH